VMSSAGQSEVPFLRISTCHHRGRGVLYECD
jgi:hypothetical protein